MDTSIVEGFAHDLLKEYGLAAKGWTFAWGTAVHTYGSCHYRQRVIRLSRPLAEVNTEGQVLDTLLHEIAHALVGPGHGHGGVWKAKAVELGAAPQQYSHGESVPHRWAGVCPTCRGVISQRHRRPNRNSSLHCSACRQQQGGGEFTEATRLEWVDAGHLQAA